MKKTAFIVILLLSVAAVSKAQQSRQRLSSEERVQRQVEQLQQKLNLTADQKAKVTAIFTAQSQSIDSLRKASNGDFQAMRGKMKPIMDTSDKQLRAVLTNDQQKTYEAYRQEQRSRMQQEGKQRSNKKK